MLNILYRVSLPLYGLNILRCYHFIKPCSGEG